MKIRVARLKVVVNTPTRLIGDAREGRPVPHVGLPAKTAGPWRAWEAGCPVRARAEITGKCAGEVREGVRGRTRGGCRRGVCSVTGRGREGARRRLVAAARRPPGRGRPEPGGRARKYS